MERWDRFMDNCPVIAFTILLVALAAAAVCLALVAAVAGMTVFAAAGAALIGALIIAIVRLGTLCSDRW